MKQYHDLVKHVLENGNEKGDRTGTGTKSVFGYQMRFDLNEGFPMVTTKKLHLKSIIYELLWFIKGDTNINYLQENGVRIWNEWANESGDLGPVYGHQWRHFNAPYVNCNTNYDGQGIDQLQNIISDLSDPSKRTSRRLVMCAWNPQQLDEMALPPCHVLIQFNVREGKYLSCALYQRSGDVGLGVPFNIASYSFLTHIIAKHCGLEADEFVYFLGNAHIYENHIEPLKEQVTRTPLPFPKLQITQKYDRIEDYCIHDITWIEDYKHHKTIKMDMVA